MLNMADSYNSIALVAKHRFKFLRKYTMAAREIADKASFVRADS